MSTFQNYQAVKISDKHPEFPGAAGNVRGDEFTHDPDGDKGDAESEPHVMVHVDSINTEVPIRVADLVSL